MCERELARYWQLAVKLRATSPHLAEGFQEGARREYEVKLKMLQFDVREAELKLQFAEAGLQEDQEISRRAPGSIRPAQMRRSQLEVELGKVALLRAQTLLDFHKESHQRNAGGSLGNKPTTDK